MARVVNPRVVRVSDEILEGYRGMSVGDIGHILLPGFMDTEIRPVWRDVHMVGRAFTVLMPGLDISLNRTALEMAQPGDVIVIDRLGDRQVACWGGAVTLRAKLKGIRGLVVDGAITDTMEISDMRFPVYSRRVSALVGRALNLDEGAVNVPVSCGGVTVEPGDLVVADDDGIAVIKPEEAAGLLQAVHDRFDRVYPIRRWLAEGKRLEDYPLG